MFYFEILCIILVNSAIFVKTTPIKGLVPLLDGRIVGGHDATIEEFPHQISMRYLNSHRCGGSIINEKTIISAAHCVDGTFKEWMMIRAGTTECRKLGVDRKVEKIFIHEEYSRNTLDNDISIVILQDELIFSPSIQPIILSGMNEMQESGNIAFVSGWGVLQESGYPGNILQYVDVTIFGQERCMQAYRGQTLITANMLCAGADKGGRDACQGDSGGPLITYDDNHVAKLIGVVSWGYGCARPEYPGVYTRISSLRNWIDEKLSNNTSNEDSL